MDTKRSFGRWVKQRRKALDLTQHALAQRIDCALSTIQKIEIDARQPSRQIAELLAKHLELAPSERDAFLHLARSGMVSTSQPLVVVPPSLRSFNNLPSPLTSLIGREWEVTTLCAHLLQDDMRLLTITGPPGSGKTRLCLQVATQLSDHFADGVCFVALAPISDARLVTAAIARALDMKEIGNQPLVERIKRYLHDRQLLLVLDNFEHVLPAAPLVVELLEAVSCLKVLVTSRALLQLYGEHEFVTPSLALPDLKALPPAHELSHYAAVELFVQRARAAKLDFTLSEENAPTIAELCIRLDGLPLAIELAAAHSKQLAPTALLAQWLNPNASHAAHLDVLTRRARNLPSRQQTLRQAIAWSYDLLNLTEQRVFRCLGVFAGGCTLEALSPVVDTTLSAAGLRSTANLENDELNLDQWLLSAVQALVNQSLVVQRTDEGVPRFTLLEMLREFALTQLEQQDEAITAHRAHALYFLQLAERFKNAASEGKAAALLGRMEQEMDNFRTALRWADLHDLALALRFSVALTEYWSQRRYLTEGRQWLEQMRLRVSTSSFQFPPEQITQYAQISGMLAFFTWLQGDFALAQSQWEETIPLWRELQNWQELGLALHFLAYTFYDRGDYAAAYGPAQESVALLRKSGEPWALGWALNILGNLMTASQQYVSAHALFEEARSIFQRIGHTWSISMLALSLGDLLFAQGNLEPARTWLEEALPTFQKSEQLWMMAQTLYLLGKVHWRQGDKMQALTLWDESVTMAREIGAKRFLAETYAMLGLAAQENNDRPQAQTFFHQSFALYQVVENKIGAAYALSGLAGLAEQPVTQAQLLGAASTVLDTARLPYDVIERTHYEQNVTTVRVQLDEITFAAAWAAGRAMSLNDVRALLLD
jgi:predicted ATPase/DNA-binding XRE family transcriptional regulator